MLHKALYSGHNDHNYFEVAHTITYVGGMVGKNLNLYTFVDNHDVERIYTKLKNKAHFVPVHVMLYTLPGIPALYYGSEFGIEGRKERHSDDSLRPALNYEDYKNAAETNECTKLIAALGKIRQNTKALMYGEYKQLVLQTTHFAYARVLDGKSVITTVNNADNAVSMNVEAGNSAAYVGALTGEKVAVSGGRMQVSVPANFGEIWIPEELYDDSIAPIKTVEIVKAPQPKVETPEPVKEVEEPKSEQAKVEPAKAVEPPKPEPVKTVETPKEEAKPEKVVVDWNKSYEDMTIEELQEAILEKMRKNGPVTEYMLGTVRENTHKGSLINWVRSFG